MKNDFSSLPKQCLDVIDTYLNLKAAEGIFVRCPYFRNPRSGRDKWGLTVYAGKGSPQEIETELKIIEKLEGKDFGAMQESEIRDIMKKRRLGIECSGFISRILSEWTRARYKKPVYSFLKFDGGISKKFFSKMRPYTHINVSILVHHDNAEEIKDMNEIMPGDIIRFDTNIDHAAIFTKTERKKNGALVEAHYAHSVFEDSGEGVKTGIIKITNPDKSLMSQTWSEEPDTGHIINEKGNPRVYRLKW